MLNGKIIADGEAGKILTNTEVLAQASIVPPQIAQIFQQLPDLGLPQNIIDVYEAQKALLHVLGESGK
jgi:hypothetical protein